jgi:hypothetical protein
MDVRDPRKDTGLRNPLERSEGDHVQNPGEVRRRNGGVARRALLAALLLNPGTGAGRNGPGRLDVPTDSRRIRRMVHVRFGRASRAGLLVGRATSSDPGLADCVRCRRRARGRGIGLAMAPAAVELAYPSPLPCPLRGHALFSPGPTRDGSPAEGYTRARSHRDDLTLELRQAHQGSPGGAPWGHVGGGRFRRPPGRGGFRSDASLDRRHLGRGAIPRLWCQRLRRPGNQQSPIAGEVKPPKMPVYARVFNRSPSDRSIT